MTTPAVYCIYNTANGKSYVGSTVSPARRYRAHLRGLRRRKHSNKGLCADWHHYGEDRFKFRILEYTDETNLRIREAAWIEKLRPHGIYNIAAVVPARATRFNKWRAARPVNRRIANNIRRDILRNSDIVDYRLAANAAVARVVTYGRNIGGT